MVEVRACLYRLDFPGGKSYVGVSTNLRNRMYGHKNHARLTQRAWMCHGAPAVVILAIGTVDWAYEMEARAIAAFGTMAPAGYNLDSGGLGGREMTLESREKVAAAARLRRHSPETKAKISAAHMGRVRGPLSAEQKRKMSERLRGRKRGPTPEATRRKISEAHLRRHRGDQDG